MKLIDVDKFRADNKFAEKCVHCERDCRRCDRQMYSANDICWWIDDAPIVDAIPIEWLEKRMQETAEATEQGKDECDLNNAIFTVLVEWERWKKEHEAD